MNPKPSQTRQIRRGRWRKVSPAQKRMVRIIRRGWRLRRKYYPFLWPNYRYWLESPSGRHKKTLNWRTGAVLWAVYAHWNRPTAWEDE